MSLDAINKWNAIPDNPNWQAALAGTVKAPTKKAQPKRSTLAKWLPAIGGATAGIAAAPFTGGLSLAATLAAIGGATALGSAAGEFGAQKSSDEKTNVGKIVKEGAIGGALGAIPLGGVGRAARVARTAGSGAAPGVAKGLGGRVADAGRRLETRAGGYGIGEKMAGKQPINFKSQSNIQSTLRTEKIPTGHPEVQARAVEAKLGRYGSELDAALSKTNKPLTDSARQKIAQGFLAKIEASPTVDASIRKNAQELARNFLRQAKDVKGVNEFRKGVDKNAISYIANPDAATAAKQQASTVLRQHLSETVSKLAPSVKQLNGKYSKLTDAQGYLVQQSGRLTRQGENAGGGISGRILTGDAAQTVKSKVGAALQRVPGAAPPTAPGIVGRGSGATTEFLKQGFGRAVANPQPMDETALQGVATDPLQDPLSDPLAVGIDPTQEPQSLYSLEQALADIQRDPENSAQYLSIYKTVAADEKAKNPNKPLGATQQKEATNAQSGLQSIQDLQTMIQSNPGVVGKSAIPGQTTLVGGYLSNALGTGEYNAAAQNIRDVISRLRSGAALTEQEEQRYKSLVPKAGDSSQTIEYKLSSLATLFQNFANPQQSGSGDLTDVLSQLQGAY